MDRNRQKQTKNIKKHTKTNRKGHKKTTLKHRQGHKRSEIDRKIYKEIETARN